MTAEDDNFARLSEHQRKRERYRDFGTRLLPPPSAPMQVARVFVDECCMFEGILTLRHWRGGWWMWRTSHWVEVDERSVRALLYRFADNATYRDIKNPNPKPWSPDRHKIGDVLDALAAICILSTDVDQLSWLYERSGGATIVAVANGLLEVDRKRLLPHTPVFFNQTSVPFHYDPAAAQPAKWLQFLGELWPDEPDAIEVLGQWFGYVISGRTDLHKILLMVGPTRGGKGASDERKMLHAVEEKKRDLQMQKYLKSHKLSRANIESIGDGRKMTLRSFGIETAWDVKSHSVRAVPGFGPMRTGKLMDWRRSLEDRFRFNPNIPTDPAEIAKVRAAMAVRRSTMETELLKGVRDLETIREESLARRGRANHYERAYIAFRQAETDASSL